VRARRLFCALLVAAAAGCSREREPPAGRKLPAGDAVWFREGIAGEERVEETLERAGISAVFLPARRMGLEDGRWVGQALPPPPAPLRRVPVFLVVTAEPAFEQALTAAGETGAPMLGGAVSRSVQETLAERNRFGRVAGVHLDLPFGEAAAGAFAKVAEVARKQLPSELALTLSLRWSPGEEARERLARVAGDAWAAFVFGGPVSAEVIAVDSLGALWWAVYSPGAHGARKGPDGSSLDAVSDAHLSLLTDTPNVELAHDLNWREEAASAFVLRPRVRVTGGGLSFEPGDTVTFRQPSISEMLYRLGADSAGRRSLRGRIIAFDGASERERVFTLEALADVLTGRPLDPEIRVAVEGKGPGPIAVGAENLAAHASVLSRVSNWVEVDVPTGGIRDVQSGGFDRYEVYDAAGSAVSLGRATRVRFFETLVGPREAIEPARIFLRGPVPPNCCRRRSHLLSAAGKERVADWAEPQPEASTTPVP